MATLLEVVIKFPPLDGNVVTALRENMEPYSDADSVVVESDNFGVRIEALYSAGELDSVSDNALTSAMCVIEAVDLDRLPHRAVVTIKDLIA